MLIENLNYHTQGAIQRNWDLKGSKTDREQNISVCIFDHSTYIIMTWKRNTFNGKTLTIFQTAEGVRKMHKVTNYHQAFFSKSALFETVHSLKGI